jgi:hypothetical protein
MAEHPATVAIFAQQQLLKAGHSTGFWYCEIQFPGDGLISPIPFG